MSDPVISIIMPAYGVGPFISKAIDSVLAQTFEMWELLVVNDGSKDNTRQVAAEYESRDSRIIVLDKENGGLSDARNFGLSFASGKYVHFFDSDDFIDSDFYEKMLSAVGSADYDFVVCGYSVDVESMESGLIVSSRRHPLFDDISPLKVNYDLHTLGEYFNFAWNKVFRKDFLLNNQLQYKKGLFGYEDSEFMSRVITFHPTFRFLGYAGYHYISRDRETLSSVLDSSTTERAFEHLLCYRVILKHFSDCSQAIDSEISKSVTGTYKALLASAAIRYKDSFSKVRAIFSQILNYERPSALFVQNRYLSAGESVFYRIVSHKKVTLLAVLYHLRFK